MWSMSMGVWPSGFAGELLGTVNGIHATGALGMLAVVCAVQVRDLTRRVRVGLAVVGAAAAGVTVWTYTPAGQAMLAWFMD